VTTESKRARDIPVEIPEAVENGAFATEMSSRTRRGGWCRANDCGGRGGLERVVDRK